MGLHPLDIRVLLGVIDRLGAKGATVVVIEPYLDMITNADYVVDMGPGGGGAGGTIVRPSCLSRSRADSFTQIAT